MPDVRELAEAITIAFDDVRAMPLPEEETETADAAGEGASTLQRAAQFTEQGRRGRRGPGGAHRVGLGGACGGWRPGKSGGPGGVEDTHAVAPGLETRPEGLTCPATKPRATKGATDHVIGPPPPGPPLPPSPWLMLLEARAPWEYAAVWAAMPWLKRGCRTAMAIRSSCCPGLQASDLSTVPMRRFLQARGYTPYGWGLGTNRGPGGGVREACRALVQRVAERHGAPVSLVGWSLGGVYAREVAKALEAQTRCVITLGSPFTGHPRANNAVRAYERVNGVRAHDPERAACLSQAPNVPTTSIYSRTDGVVDWRCSLNETAPHTENIEVAASHIGMGVNPLVLYVIADRLRQDPKHWQRFDAKTAHRLFFRGEQARQYREAQA